MDKNADSRPSLCRYRIRNAVCIFSQTLAPPPQLFCSPKCDNCYSMVLPRFFLRESCDICGSPCDKMKKLFVTRGNWPWSHLTSLSTERNKYVIRYYLLWGSEILTYPKAPQTVVHRPVLWIGLLSVRNPVTREMESKHSETPLTRSLGGSVS